MIVHTTSNQSDFPQLLKHVDTETPISATDVDHVREVSTAFLIKDLSIPLVHHRKQQPRHFFHLDRRSVERLQGTVDSHDRWLTYFEVKVTTFQLHNRAE